MHTAVRPGVWRRWSDLQQRLCGACRRGRSSKSGQLRRRAESGCPETFDPVCGVDGNTYINECFAAKSSVEVAGLGACTPNGCPSEYEPVCGMNGRTFINRCEAAAERVPVQRKGTCDFDNCPRVYAPVCADDGETYENACYCGRGWRRRLHRGRMQCARLPDSVRAGVWVGWPDLQQRLSCGASGRAH